MNFLQMLYSLNGNLGLWGYLKNLPYPYELTSAHPEYMSAINSATLHRSALKTASAVLNNRRLDFYERISVNHRNKG